MRQNFYLSSKGQNPYNLACLQRKPLLRQFRVYWTSTWCLQGKVSVTVQRLMSDEITTQTHKKQCI